MAIIGRLFPSLEVQRIVALAAAYCHLRQDRQNSQDIEPVRRREYHRTPLAADANRIVGLTLH